LETFLKSEELKTRQFLWVDYLTSERLSGTNHFQQLYNLRFLKKTPNHKRILNASKSPFEGRWSSKQELWMIRGMREVYELLNFTAFCKDIPRKISERDFEPPQNGDYLNKLIRVAKCAILG
jgi:hypothetical protein